MSKQLRSNEMTRVRQINTMCLFMVAYLLSYIDRQILALLIGPIQSDLLLSDTQFACLNGLAFSLLYAILGFPLASMSDRYPRPPIIVGGVILWSLATMACGLCNSFWSLFLCRVLVGLGEAALAPAVYSYIADTVPRERLAGTLAFFFLGSFLGSGCAFLFGGWLLAFVQQHHFMILHAWQICFMVVGLPGIFLGIIIALTVHEPSCRTVPARPATTSVAISFFRNHRTFFSLHMLGYTLLAVTLFSLFSWMPAQMMRIHHMSHTELGLTLGIIVIVAGCGGAFTSGRLIDILTKRGIWVRASTRSKQCSLCSKHTACHQRHYNEHPSGHHLFFRSLLLCLFPDASLGNSSPDCCACPHAGTLFRCHAVLQRHWWIVRRISSYRCPE